LLLSLGKNEGGGLYVNQEGLSGGIEDGEGCEIGGALRLKKRATCKAIVELDDAVKLIKTTILL